MTRQRKIVWAKAAVLMGALPILLFAYEYGPDPGYAGVPFENGGAAGATCASSGCHTGTVNDPNNKGSVVVNFPNGLVYTPGESQSLSVTISDPTEKAAGFELTARETSVPSTMAGTFASVDANTQVVCSQPSLQIFNQVASGTQCKSSYPLQYIEQSSLQSGGTGFENSIAHGLPYTYNFTWTPPASNVCGITIYVAANAGVGNPPTQDGDHIYSRQYVLTPSDGNACINPSGVSNGASFSPGIVPNSWITIKGSQLASTTDTWNNAIVNGALPTTLDGVNVSVGGKPAYIYFISPTQINALAPNVDAGSTQVTVTNGSGTNVTATATVQSAQPAFFLWGDYAVTTHTDNTWAVQSGFFPGVTTKPAKPGETIVLWGTGFGATKPAVPVGVATPSDQLYATASPVTVTLTNSVTRQRNPPPFSNVGAYARGRRTLSDRHSASLVSRE